MRSIQTLLFVSIYYCVIIVNSQLDEFERCISDRGRSGTCLLIDKCQAAVQMVRKRNKPKLCGFVGKIPIVCCENVQSRTMSIAAKKCLEYKTKSIPTTTTTTTTTASPSGTTTEGFVGPGAIGGEDALPLEFPHMAILGYGDASDIKWFCGGSLISENFVLTAAHCIYTKYGNVSTVKLGAHQLNFITKYIQTFDVKRIYTYPEYYPFQKYHDIALIELDHPANIQTGVQPACLHISPQLPDISFTATGWGATELHGDMTDILQKVNLRYVSYDSCAARYSKLKELKKGLINEWQICANGGNERADTCQGDSGGPLHLPKNEDMLYSVVGITSFGLKCALVPAVYTRVSYYVPWIESIVWSS